MRGTATEGSRLLPLRIFNAAVGLARNLTAQMAELQEAAASVLDSHQSIARTQCIKAAAGVLPACMAADGRRRLGRASADKVLLRLHHPSLCSGACIAIGRAT